MLDNGTKKRIDSARDILVGKVPDPKSQVEQITIAMIYKFMDDMDNQTEELGGKATFFTGKFKQYAWSRLLDSKLGGHERLIFYAEGIEKMNINENIPQLFRDIFKGAFLPYRDPETLNLFLKEINGFAYDHSERLGDAFEYLLSVLSSQGDAGQFRTPRHVIDFIVEIVDPAKEDTVLDPACGTAGFLISSYKHILRQNTKSRPGDLLTTDDKGRLMTNFCGYDISPDMVRLSLVNMYLHSFANPSIYEYDTLTSEDRWDERYDVIMANPPFMSPKGGIRPHSRFTIKAKRSEVLFVDYIAEHLNVHGKAGVIVPEGIIFQSQSAYKNLRRMLIDEGYLYAVISMPAGVFQPYSGVKTSILIMDKTLAKKTGEILFVKVSNDGFDLGAQRRTIDKNDLPQALKIVKAWKEAIAKGNGFELDEDSRAIAHAVSKKKITESGDYNLSGDRYREAISYANVKWPMVELGEVCDIFNGSRPKGGAINSGVLSIGGEHLNYDGSFKLRKPKYISEEYFKKLKRGKLENNDVLVVKDGATTGKTGYFDGNSPFKIGAVNEHVFILRAKNKNQYNPFLLFKILKSEFGQKEFLKYKTGAAQGGINLSIKKIEIPLPPLEVQEKIVAELDGYQKIIDGAKQIVKNYKPTIKIDPDWPLVELEKVCAMEYGYTAKAQESGDTRFIRITDIDDNACLISDNPMFIDLSEESKPYLLEKGDVLIARTGATYGKTLLFGDNEQAVFASYLIRLSFNHDKVVPAFFTSFSLGEIYWQQARELVSGGGQPQFNANVIKRIRMPIPPIKTQQKIVAEIESERELVEANKKLIEIFEKKIKDKIGEVWGE